MGAKAIKSAYPMKNWSIETLKTICRWIDATGSAVEKKTGSGRLKSAGSADNITKVHDLICSQDDKPGTSKSACQVAAEVGISEWSVRRIAKRDLNLLSFKRMPVQVIMDATKQKLLMRPSTVMTIDGNEGKDSDFH